MALWHDIEAPTEMIEAPKTKPRKARRKRRAVARTIIAPVKPAKIPDEFAGMTATECCLGCKVERCVITAIGICGHPMKGGLQAPLMIKPEVVERYSRARKALAHIKIDKLP